jgi:hypothetical protein
MTTNGRTALSALSNHFNGGAQIKTRLTSHTVHDAASAPPQLSPLIRDGVDADDMSHYDHPGLRHLASRRKIRRRIGRNES